MDNFKNTKDRLLSMHSRLMEGKMLYKAEEAKRFGCSLRSIQRDIDDLRSFFFNQISPFLQGPPIFTSASEEGGKQKENVLFIHILP